MTEIPKKSGVAERQHLARRAGVVAVAAGTAGMAGVAFAAPAFTQTAAQRHIPTEPLLAAVPAVHAQPAARSAAVPALTRTVDAAIAKHALHQNAVRAHAVPHQTAVRHQATPHAALKTDGMPAPQPIHVEPHHFSFHHRHHEARHEGHEGHHPDCDRHRKCTCKGQPGPQGAMGAQGANGMNGMNGMNGAQGAQGSPGAQGAQGAGGTGSQGPQGSPGAQGNQGAQGTPGAQGAQGSGGGAQGAQGSPGAQGAQGSPGAQGSQGSPGAQGNQGTQGSQGAQGGPSNDIDLDNHGDTEIRATLQASTGKTFVTIGRTGTAQDLSGLPGYIPGVVDISEHVHTQNGGDHIGFVIVNATGDARILDCKLSGAGNPPGLESGATPATACPAGWQTITFP
jgi:hypothetical protein